VKYVLIGLLKVYRLVISPLYGDVCRYYPSCSAYALRAVGVHGAVKGSWLAARRLLRCHPWAAGGYDPVPGTPEFEAEMRETQARARTMEHVAPERDRPDRTLPVDTVSPTSRHAPHGASGTTAPPHPRVRRHHEV
jgi:putative membrane protein insertion efficiency factor